MLALAGGVGGAKLADGFAQLAGPALTIVVNTGDDFIHLGLHVSPDIDTVMYTLAGLANPVTGWGVKDETWSTMGTLEVLGGPVWFKLGDHDLAMHLQRTQRLRDGASLSVVTAEIGAKLGITSRIVPMSDDSVRTIVATPEGELGFQDYFVGRQCKVAVTGFRFAGIGMAQPAPELMEALTGTAHDFIAICPSNPFVSIDPILGLAGVRAALLARNKPAIAVSPIIAGAAVKGPAAKMMQELGIEVSTLSIARHYAGLIDGLVIDKADAALQTAIEATGMAVHVTPTLMRNAADRKKLAKECIAFAARLMRAA